MRTLLLATLVTGLLLGPQSPAPSAPSSTPDLAALGPQPGERVPDFALQDQRGERRTLTSVLGPNGAMLVFFRSADW